MQTLHTGEVSLNLGCFARIVFNPVIQENCTLTRLNLDPDNTAARYNTHARPRPSRTVPQRLCAVRALRKSELTQTQTRKMQHVADTLPRSVVLTLNAMHRIGGWYHSPHQVLCMIALARGSSYYEVANVTHAEVSLALDRLIENEVPVTAFNLIEF
jgi:hypothetical protein